MDVVGVEKVLTATGGVKVCQPTRCRVGRDGSNEFGNGTGRSKQRLDGISGLLRGHGWSDAPVGEVRLVKGQQVLGGIGRVDQADGTGNVAGKGRHGDLAGVASQAKGNVVGSTRDLGKLRRRVSRVKDDILEASRAVRTRILALIVQGGRSKCRGHAVAEEKHLDQSHG